MRGVRTFSQDKELVEARRKEIVRSASHVFIQKGYQDTGMREIAEAFGKSTGSLYHYVGSKEDILYLILNFVVTNEREYLEEIRRSIEGLSSGDAIIRAIDIYTRRLNEYADMHIFLNHVMVMLNNEERKMMFDTSSNITNFLVELVEKGVKDREFHTPNPRMAAWNIINVCNGWVIRRWFWKDTHTIEDYIRQQTELILMMLGISSPEEKLKTLLPPLVAGK